MVFQHDRIRSPSPGTELSGLQIRLCPKADRDSAGGERRGLSARHCPAVPRHDSALLIYRFLWRTNLYGVAVFERWKEGDGSPSAPIRRVRRLSSEATQLWGEWGQPR